MFYLTKERQMLFDAANRYIFDEEVSEEFKQDLYNDFDEYKQLIPSHFYEAIVQKQLFHDEAALAKFEVWCDGVKEQFIEKSGEQHERREHIAQQFHVSAQQLMQQSFHDGEIVAAKFVGNDFLLLLNMSGGFLPHAFVKLTFIDAKLEGQLAGYYIYDELQQLPDGFGLRILSSFGYPYAQSTIVFCDVRAEGVYRPAIYVEPDGVSDWETFKSRLRDDFTYFIVQNDAFHVINIQAIVQGEDGFYLNDTRIAATYEELTEKIVCDGYEDPYAHLSEPLAIDALYDAVFGSDDTLRVRALNTMFALGEQAAPIVTLVLQDAVLTEDNEMYFFALANHFYQQRLIDEALLEKWQ